jgi:hypothetical protein
VSVCLHGCVGVRVCGCVCVGVEGVYKVLNIMINRASIKRRIKKWTEREIKK